MFDLPADNFWTDTTSTIYSDARPFLGSSATINVEAAPDIELRFISPRVESDTEIPLKPLMYPTDYLDATSAENLRYTIPSASIYQGNVRKWSGLTLLKKSSSSRIENFLKSKMPDVVSEYLSTRSSFTRNVETTLEFVRDYYPDELLCLELIRDPDDGDRFLALTIWEPAGTPLEQGEARYERFIERWVSNPAFQSSDIAISLHYAE